MMIRPRVIHAHEMPFGRGCLMHLTAAAALVAVSVVKAARR